MRLLKGYPILCFECAVLMRELSGAHVREESCDLPQVSQTVVTGCAEPIAFV